MKLINISDYPKLEGYSQVESAIIGYNNISNDQISCILPDLFQRLHTIDDYLNYMEPIKLGEEFVKKVKELKNQKFCVVGDYDCDGIMATAIMCYGLALCGIETIFTISNRFETGYGMHKEQVDVAIENGATVIITVDNGIVANDIIKYAQDNGITVIVTDHHTPQGENIADLVIDPQYNNDDFIPISGATVAMKLVYNLYKEYNFDKNFLYDFVTMAYFTVYSDVMPLIGENRYLVEVAEAYANYSVNIKDSFINKLASLLDYYKFNNNTDPYLNLEGSFKAFNKNNVDFYFVPIINACNRVIGDVNELVYDIMTLFSGDYTGVPHLYSGLNKKRKFMRTELTRKHKPNEKKAVVEALTPDFWDDNYSGIVGLVASDVVDREHKPALIGIDNDNLVHFSGRSVTGFNLFDALTEIKNEHPELSLSFGGHAEALGAACLKSDIPLLEDYLSEKFSKVSIESVEPVYMKLEKQNEIIECYNNFYPFGNRFEFPKFYIKDRIRYLNTKDRSFTLKSLDDLKIKYFDKKTEEKLSSYAFDKREESIECILSIMKDDDNQIVLKLDQIIKQ